LQHPFIRDVTDMHPLIELVSEANAEVVYEEKDIDVSIVTAVRCRIVVCCAK